MISNTGLLNGKSRLLTRWDQSRPATLDNLVLVSKEEAADLAENGWANVDPAIVERVNARLQEMAHGDKVDSSVFV